MGHQPMVANGDAQTADDIEQPKQGPVNPAVVVEISIERDSDYRTCGNCTKDDDGPDSVAATDFDRDTRVGDGRYGRLWNLRLLYCLVHGGVSPNELAAGSGWLLLSAAC